MAKKQSSLPKLFTLAVGKLSPLEIIQDKTNIVSDSLNYLAARPGGKGYTTAEDAAIKVQLLRFSARLADLNDQFAAVLADEKSVVLPTPDQVQAMLDTAQALAKLNRDQAIADAVTNFLKAAFDAAEPLTKV